MNAAHANDIEIEGACEGNVIRSRSCSCIDQAMAVGVCACSTCHVILENQVYDKLPAPSEDEEDMLDQAFGLTATSRLGCQVVLTEELNGIRVTLPKATRNFYVVRFIWLDHVQL